MERKGWFGLIPFLEEWNPSEDKAEKSALVLAGGGSRGSFQIGALRYLYSKTDLAPETIVGTSAGSIVGATLAQSKDPAAQHAYLRKVEQLWLGMNSQDEMFQTRHWVDTLQNLLPELRSIVEAEQKADRIEFPNPLAKIYPRLRGQEQDVAIPELPPAPTDPQEITVQLATKDAQAKPIAWNPALVAALWNAVPTIGRHGGDVAGALREAGDAGSLFVPGKIITQLLSRETFDSTKVANSGVDFRAAMVGLRTGKLRFIRGDGVIVNEIDQPIGEEPYELSLGILASCSIPGAFRPVELGQEIYVDGGTRENVPVELAISALGVTKPVVITCHPKEMLPAKELSPNDIIAVMMRAVTVVTNETERDEVEYARSSGALVIDPLFGVHDMLEIEPGLLTINRDYGWIRAAEETLNAPLKAREINTSIIKARMQSWALEKEVITGNTDSEIAAQISTIKLRIHDLMLRADKQLLPPWHNAWWQNYEKHAT